MEYTAILTKGMLHRTALYRKLSLLTKYRFVQYIERIDASNHIVRLYCMTLQDDLGMERGYTDLFIITEHNGFLSACSLDGGLCMPVLT